MALTGNKDVDYLILDLLDDRELVNVCQTNKKANHLCNDDQFWKRRTQSRFGKYLTPLGINMEEYIKYKTDPWKEYYIKLKSVVDATKYGWEVGGNNDLDFNWNRDIKTVWESFKKQPNNKNGGLDIYVGSDQYNRNHPIGFRKLKSPDEQALALQVAIVNDPKLYKDISELPIDSPLFDFKNFYNSVDIPKILKRKNLLHLEKIKQIFSNIDPNRLIVASNFFKKNRVPFLQIILEDKRLTKKALLRAISDYKVSDEAKVLLIEKLRDFGVNTDDLSKKILKKIF